MWARGGGPAQRDDDAGRVAIHEFHAALATLRLAEEREGREQERRRQASQRTECITYSALCITYSARSTGARCLLMPRPTCKHAFAFIPSPATYGHDGCTHANLPRTLTHAGGDQSASGVARQSYTTTATPADSAAIPQALRERRLESYSPPRACLSRCRGAGTSSTQNS